MEGMEHRLEIPFGQSNPSKLGQALPSDFDCRPPGFEQQESDSIVHPKPIPEVLDDIKRIIEENPNDGMLKQGEYYSSLLKRMPCIVEYDLTI